MRKPVAAASFYPADKSSLINQINDFLDKAKKVETNQRVAILIAPHAGYDYSGQTAGWAYKQIENQNYQKIILLGCSHRVYFDYAAIDNQSAWQTPLGQIKINKTGINQSEIIKPDSGPHKQEHSLEVQLPFLQAVLKKFTPHQSKLGAGFQVVPILLGQTNNQVLEDLAKAISNNFDEKTLLIISSDLCHYPNEKTAKIVDQETIKAILTGKVEKFSLVLAKNTGKNGVDTCACAAEAIKVGMMVAQNLNIREIKLLNYTNSADTSGDKDRVVGYASIGFYKHISNVKSQISKPNLKTVNLFNPIQQQKLLKIARESLIAYFGNKKIPKIRVDDPELQKNPGVFVTLTKNDQLRGCIGQLETIKPLSQTVAEKVIDAAFNDPRFDPITAEELNQIKIEISILSPLQKIDDWRQIKLGKDGVLIKQGFRAGLFLPQVATETGWDLETFLEHLCMNKAGLEPVAYKDPKTQIYVFQTQVFSE